MRIEGERRFAAPPGEVYAALTDPDEIGAAFSAIEVVEVKGDEWKVVVRPPLPGGFRVKFSVRLDDLQPPEHARLRAWGKSLGGRMSVDSTFDLEPDGDGTQMHWQAEVEAAGLFSGLGNQALGPVASRHADRALGRLADRLARARAR